MTSDECRRLSLRHKLFLKLTKLRARPALRLCAYIFIARFVCAASVLAAPAQMQLPSEIPQLPALAPNGEPTLLIKGEEAFKYRALIAPEIYQLVRSGDLVIPAGSALAYEPHAPQAVAAPPPEQSTVSGQLPADYRLSASLPFGIDSAAEIKPEDSKQLARKILWNSAAALWGAQIIDTTFDLISLRAGKFEHSFNARAVRMYPGLVGIEGRPGQLFKEWVRFNAPKPVERFSWLTYRFLGAEEDLVWLYSPVIQKTRQVTGSNRSDSILGTNFTLEDIFTWSVKPELMDATVESAHPIFVAFPAAAAALAKPTDGEEKCHRAVESGAAGSTNLGEQVSAEGGVSSVWNFETGHAANGAGWLPQSVVYVPRKTWRIELAAQDPYSQYGRQVLYVDAATYLPFMNVVYDRAGLQQKVVVSAFGEMQAGEYHAPYLAWSVVFAPDSSRATVFKVSQYTACRAFKDEFSAESFDPRRLGGAS